MEWKLRGYLEGQPSYQERAAAQQALDVLVQKAKPHKHVIDNIRLVGWGKWHSTILAKYMRKITCLAPLYAAQWRHERPAESNWFRSWPCCFSNRYKKSLWPYCAATWMHVKPEGSASAMSAPPATHASHASPPLFTAAQWIAAWPITSSVASTWAPTWSKKLTISALLLSAAHCNNKYLPCIHTAISTHAVYLFSWITAIIDS